MDNTNDTTDNNNEPAAIETVEAPEAPKLTARFPLNRATRVLFDANEDLGTDETELVELRVTLAPRVRTSISFDTETFALLTKGLTTFDAIEVTGTPVAKNTYASRRGEDQYDIRVAWDLTTLAVVRNKALRGLPLPKLAELPVRDNRDEKSETEKTEKPKKTAVSAEDVIRQKTEQSQQSQEAAD